MTWASHQSAGFFGFTPGETPQPRWQHVVDVEEAFEAAHDVREAFMRWMQWPDDAPFSGGVLDAWPARMADGLAFAKREWRAVQANESQQHKG